MSDRMPYPIDTDRTHYDGCWRNRRHHNCAVERVAELEAQVQRLTDDLTTVTFHRDVLQQKADNYGERIDVLTEERDAYKRAKAENDERFMLERDEARARAEHAEEQWGRLAAVFVDADEQQRRVRLACNRPTRATVLTDEDHKRAQEWRQSQGATDAD